MSHPLLSQARNCVKFSEKNNDLLEFIGDRVVNLATALIVEEAKVSKNHHMTVRRVICNNDTFGRLAFCLHLDHHAHFDPQNSRDVAMWNPQLSIPPPKGFADLFEAYAAAVYLQYGWKKLRHWLETLFGPIIKVATKDYWYTPPPLKMFPRNHSPAITNGSATQSDVQRQLLNFLSSKRELLISRGQPALVALPPAAHFNDNGQLAESDYERVEVAIHVMNMWICKIFITVWPEYQFATARAAHLISAITGLIISEPSMAYLGSLLSLSTYFSGDDADREHISCQRQGKRCDNHPLTLSTSSLTPGQLSQALKVVIGCFYYTNPEAADSWGVSWFRPIVLRAHDILVQKRSYQPAMSRLTTLNTFSSCNDAVASSSALELEIDSLSELVNKVQSMSIHKAGDPVNQPAELALPSSMLGNLTAATQAKSCQHPVVILRTRDMNRASQPNQLLTGGTVATFHKPATTSPNTTLQRRDSIITSKWRPIGQTPPVLGGEKKENLPQGCSKTDVKLALNPPSPEASAPSGQPCPHSVEATALRLASSSSPFPSPSLLPSSSSSSTLFIPRQILKKSARLNC